MTGLCVVCSSRKGRRECPALMSRICAQCCGRRRRRGIDCPDDCPFFVAGLRLALLKLTRASGDPEFERRWSDVLHNFRRALSRSEVRELSDDEARAALQNAASTLRTKSKGLIYSFHSPDPRVQLSTEELLQVADAHEYGRHGLRRTNPAELAACLRHLERTAESFIRQEPGTNRFVELAAQSVGHKLSAGTGEWTN